MKTVIISKFGGVFRSRAALKGASASGEQGETEGIIRHIAARGDCRVVVFGTNHVADNEGFNVVNADLSRMREVGTDPLCVTEQQQVAGWNADTENVLAACGDAPPVALICVNGYSPTFSHVHNPRGATVQCAAMNYAAPVLALCEHLKLPRLCVNNDPRTYPRDQEMSYEWEWARPRALLDQTSAEGYQVVGGKRYFRKSVHARVESWSWLPNDALQSWHDRDHENAHVVAHAHINDGIRNGSSSAWDIVFGDPPGCNIYGAGWEHYFNGRNKGRIEFHGKVTPKEVIEKMDWSLCAPVVSHSPSFYTGKPYLMTSRGCVPLLFGGCSASNYGHQHTHTYDNSELLQPLSAQSRIVRPGDFRRLFELLASDERHYQDALSYWQEACRPRYDALDQLVDELLDGTWREDPTRWGGYFAC